MAVHVRKLNKKETNVRIIGARRFVIRTLLNITRYFSPAKAVDIVNTHVFKPAVYRSSAEEEQFLNSGSTFQIEIHGKTVQGWKWGEGPGILFVHGWNGRGIQFKRFFAPLIESGYTAIAFDAPGHGASGGKTSSYFEWTDTIRAMLNPSIESFEKSRPGFDEQLEDILNFEKISAVS